MDIHPPEHPIRSLRDFVIQLFTVTCGIVIALGLESLVVRHHEAALAHQARIEFAAEIAENQDRVRAAVAESGTILAWMEALIAAGTAREHHQPYKMPAGPNTRHFITLPATAWDTALATQAVSLLSFAEVRALSAAYTRQSALADLNGKARDQWVSMAAYGDIADLSDDDVRHGLKDVMVAYAYARSIADLEARLMESYAAAARALEK
jgi:hypothetical protein